MRLSVSSLAIGIIVGAVGGALVSSALMSRYYAIGKAHSFTLIDQFTGDVHYCGRNQDYEMKCESLETNPDDSPHWSVKQ